MKDIKSLLPKAVGGSGEKNINPEMINDPVTMDEYNAAVSALTEEKTELVDENNRLKTYITVLQRENTRLKCRKGNTNI